MGKHKILTDSERESLQKQRKPRKKLSVKAKIAVISIAVVVALVFSWVITCAVSAYTVLNPERKALSLDDGPIERDLVYNTFDLPGLNSGDQIICWWIPSQDYMGEFTDSNKTVVISHNYGSNREMIEISAIYLVEDIVHAGYNVVMFDYSGSGNAKGKNYTFGAEESEELGLVVDYIKETYSQEHIAVLGWGFGAAAAIVAGSENENVSCVIADGSYLDLRSYLEENLSVWTFMPDGLFTPLTLKFMELMSGCDFELSPYNAVADASGKSFLFFHGINDYIFPYENSNVLFDRASENNFADIALFNTLHIYGLMAYEENYTNEVLDFLGNRLGAEPYEVPAE